MATYDSPWDITDRAFVFGCRIVRFCDPLMTRRGASAVLGRELLKAGTSIGANLEEAKGAQSRPDFITKNCIAHKEARESHYWLRVLEATITPLPDDAGALREEAGQVVAILTSIVKTAKSRGPRR